jgi:Spy/CpxP family protein refolding chaperone
MHPVFVSALLEARSSQRRWLHVAAFTLALVAPTLASSVASAHTEELRQLEENLPTRGELEERLQITPEQRQKVREILRQQERELDALRPLRREHRGQQREERRSH